jgi:hypothetical protein
MSKNKNGYTRYDCIAMRGIKHNLYQPGKFMDKCRESLNFSIQEEKWRKFLSTYLSRKMQKDLFIFQKNNVFVCFKKEERDGGKKEEILEISLSKR